MKKILWVLAAVFGTLAIILYFASLNQLDSSTARVLGTSTIVNIQGTVFCAGCAVICAVFSAAALILTEIENHETARYYTQVRQNAEQTTESLTSYWVCPKCNTKNPRSKVECRECGTTRP